MAIKEGDHLLDDGDTTLSSSELDSVLSSAEFQDMDAEDSSLEQYGVWVKVKPEDLETPEEGEDESGLSDLAAGEELGLTAEEEELLGELEDEPMEAGEFEGLEADLEALGRSEEPGGQDLEISVDDLDLELQDFGPADSAAEAEQTLESLPESLTYLSGDQEIEVPLSEDAVVEEHFAGLTPLGAAGAAAGSSKASADILEQIEADLKQIKTEIQTLKRELTSIGRAGASGQVEVQPVAEGPPGFFNQEEDETIALTGDELDNILNTADITEETAEPMLDEPEDELPELEENAELVDLEEITAPEGEDEILALGALDLDEEQPAEALPEIQLDMGGDEGSASELPEDGELLLDEVGEAEEPIDLDLENLSTDAAFPAEEAEELILEDLGEASEGEEELLLDEPEAEEPLGEGITLDTDAGQGETDMEELELEELEISADEEDAEPVGDSMETFELGEEELEAVDLEEIGATEAMEELNSLSGIESPGAEPEAEDEELLELEELIEVGDEDSGEDLSLDEPALAEEDTAAALELPDEIEEIEAVDELSGEAGVEAPRSAAGMSPELKKDVTSVLSYLDALLEALPEEKIREFAQSEYFETYKRLFDELGLGA